VAVALAGAVRVLAATAAEKLGWAVVATVAKAAGVDSALGMEKAAPVEARVEAWKRKETRVVLEHTVAVVASAAALVASQEAAVMEVGTAAPAGREATLEAKVAREGRVAATVVQGTTAEEQVLWRPRI